MSMVKKLFKLSNIFFNSDGIVAVIFIAVVTVVVLDVVIGYHSFYFYYCYSHSHHTIFLPFCM